VDYDDIESLHIQKTLAEKALSMFYLREEDSRGLIRERLDILKIQVAIAFLRERTRKNGEIDPYIITHNTAWDYVTDQLGPRWSDIGLDFAIAYLDACYLTQGRTRKRVHKGTPYFYVSKRLAERGDRDLAESNMLLAYIEDVLTEKGENKDPLETGAASRLHNTYGYSKRTLKGILKKREVFAEDPLYPEELLMEFQITEGFLPIVLPFNRYFVAYRLKRLMQTPGG